MENQEKKKELGFPTFGCVFCAIGGIVMLVLIIIELCKGIKYAFQEGGWAWLLVVGGFILFVGLVALAAQKR